MIVTQRGLDQDNIYQGLFEQKFRPVEVKLGSVGNARTQ